MSESAGKLTFVHFERSPLETDKAARKLVRSTAMKRFRQRQRAERVEQFQKREDLVHRTRGESPSSTASPLIPYRPTNEVSDVEPKAYLQASLISSKNVSPYIELHVDDYNPLQSLKRASHPFERTLFKHWAVNLAPTVTPLEDWTEPNSTITKWVQGALQQRVMLEAVLLYSCAHWDRARHQPWSRLTLYHKGQCMRAVNETLRSADATSDASIAAVIMLAGSGVPGTLDDESEPKLHMKALHSMVKSRGGLDKLGMDGVLKMLCTVMDDISSTIWRTKPFFEVPTTSIVIDPSSDLEEELRLILKDMTGLSNTIERLSARLGSNASHTMGFRNLRSDVERRLVALQDILTSGNTTLESLILKAACVAARVYYQHFVRHVSLSTFKAQPLIRELVKDLMDSDSSLRVPIKDSLIEIVLWTMFIGGLVSDEKSRFAEAMACVMVEHNIHTWVEIKAIFENLSWPDRMRSLDHRDFLQEVNTHIYAKMVSSSKSQDTEITATQNYDNFISN